MKRIAAVLFALFVASLAVAADVTTSITPNLPLSISGPTNGQCLVFNSTTGWWGNANCAGGGTFTSIGVTVPSWLTATPGTLTANGTFAITATSGLTANQFIGTPNGSTGPVGLRSLVTADIPTISLSSGVNGTLQAGQEPAHTGDCTNTAASLALTCNKTNGTAFGSWATSTDTTTGSGSVLALATSPTFVTPTLGAATATSINVSAGVVAASYSTVSSLAAGSGNAAANSTIINAAIQVSGADVIIPPGTYYINPLLMNANGVHLHGSGIYPTQFICVPTGNTNTLPGDNIVDPGTCLQVAKHGGAPGNILYSSSADNLYFTTTDTTHSINCIRLVETSQFVLHDISCQNFYSSTANDVGLQVMGHELGDVYNMDLETNVGVHISQAPSFYGDVVPTNSATASFSGTSGSVTVTFSAAALAGNSGDVGRHITILDTTYKTCAITAFTSTTVATCTLTGNPSATLSGTGPFANNLLLISLVGAVHYDADQFHFHNLYLVPFNAGGNPPSTYPWASVYIDSGVFLSNTKFDGSQAWVGGKYGLYWVSPASSIAASYQVVFENVRPEQLTGTPSYGYYIDNTGGSQIQTLSWRNNYMNGIVNGSGACWYLKGVIFNANMTDSSCVATTGGPPYVVDDESTVEQMTWVNMSTSSGAANHIPAGMVPSNAVYLGSGGPFLPTSATWTAGLGARVSISAASGASNDVVPGDARFPNTVTSLAITTTAGVANWTGLCAVTSLCNGPVDGQIIRLDNLAGGNALTLNNQNAGSSSADRFCAPNGVDYVLATGTSVSVQQDVTRGCWVILQNSTGTVGLTTFNGAIQTPAGSSGTLAAQIGVSNTGFYETGGVLEFYSNGTNTAAFNSGTAQFNGTLNMSSGSILMSGHAWLTQSAPTVTSGGGTSPTVTAQTTKVFKVTEGATGSPSATLVIAMPAGNVNSDWVCTAQDRTSSSITARQSGAASTSSVTITFSGAPSNSDVIQFQCDAM